MKNEFSQEERLSYLVIMLCGWEKLFCKIYEESDEENKERIMKAAAEYMQELEPVMDAYGLKRDPEGIARAMVMTEDIIGCQPTGELESVSSEEAIRKVTYCPFVGTITGDLCRFQMAALEDGLGKKHGLEITCDQTMADGADHCIWRVKKKS